MHASFLIDKTFSVPPGKKIVTDYVHRDVITLGCRSVMAIGDVAAKYELVKQNAPNSLFPAPMGEWKDNRFVVIDGRHTVMAYVLHGYEYILVSWIE